MTDNNNLQPQLPRFMDSTMLSTLRACPKKFYWQYMLNLKPQGSSIHLTAGGAFADALDTARKLQAKSSTPLDHESLVEAAFASFLSKWDMPLDMPEQTKNFHNMFYALELYLQEHHPYYDDVQPYTLPNGKTASEFSFAIPLKINRPNGEPWLYVGRFDMLGMYRPGGFACVFDDKTTGSLGSYWLNQWDLRGQFLGYIWACRQLGYDISHAVVRGTGILKTETKFITVPLAYTDHLIQRWEEELYHSLEYVMFLAAKNHWPYNFGDSCSSYGGCPMKELCKAREPSQWFNNYDVRIWSPVDMDGD